MQIIDVKQGSEAWLAARVGIPTASGFDQIITPAKLERSKSRGPYLARLFAEGWLGQPLDDAHSPYMDRGTELEGEAIARYEFDTDCVVRRVGFVLTDDGTAGCSPDGLVGDDGLVEVKVPGAATHAEYLLYGFGDAYRLQRQGQLWVTGRKWVEMWSYSPVMPPVRERHERDEKVMAALDREIPAFCEELKALRDRYADAREVALVGADDDGQPF